MLKLKIVKQLITLQILIYLKFQDNKKKFRIGTFFVTLLVTRTGFEPINACVKGMCVNHFTNGPKQMVGLNGLEPSTSRLSGVRSNQLSYKPICFLLVIRQPPILPSSYPYSTIGRF